MRDWVLKFALIAFALVPVVVASVGAVQGDPVFRSRSDNVPVFVSVTDKSHRLAIGLTRDAFEVRDQGRPRPIVLFDSSPQPVQLVVMMDVSGSMVGNLALLRSACSELIAHLGPGDLAKIGTFGRDIAVSPAFTRDAAVLQKDIPREIEPSAPTPLWLALDRAIGAFRADGARRVVLVLSDGKDTSVAGVHGTIVDAHSVAERAAREDVMVYVVALSSRPPVSSIAPRPRSLQDLDDENRPDPGLLPLASDTGGGYKEIEQKQNIPAEFGRIVDELHQQYLVGFDPATHDGKLHKLDIAVRGAGEVRARRVYQAPAP